MYALNPIKIENSKLAQEIATDFKDFDDVAISSLARSIGENKSNDDVLRVLIDNFVSIAIENYPEIAFGFFEETVKEEEKEKKAKKGGQESPY